MRRLIFLLCVIGTLATTSCKKDDPYNISGDYQLTEAATITVSKRKMPVQIGVSNITSTLCPPNALCISQGFGSADVAFKTNDGQTTVKVCNGVCNGIPTKEKVTLNGINYEVTLTDVKLIGSTNKFSATISLTKLSN